MAARTAIIRPQIVAAQESQQPTLRLRAQLGGVTVNPEVRKEVENNVKQLSQHVRAIRDNFNDVSGYIAKFDSAGYKGESGKVLKLRPTWDGLLRRFDECAALGLQRANEAVANMRSISEILGEAATTPLTNTQLREGLIERLESFAKALSENEEEARLVQGQFRAVADDLQVLATQINNALKQADQSLQSEVETVGSRILQLQREADGLPYNSGICWSDCNKDKRNELRRQIGQLAQQRDRIRNNQIPELAEHRANLERHLPSVENIANEINIMADIWGMVASDTYGLIEYLNGNFASGTSVTRFWRMKLGYARTRYIDLSKILNMYVVEAGKAAE